MSGRPFRDVTPTRTHVLVGIAMAGLVVLTALSITSVTRDRLAEAHLVERAAKEGAQAGKAAAKKEVKAQVQEKVESEVQDQLDDRLVYPTIVPRPSEQQPIDPVQPTTTLAGPFNLTTTTTEAPPPTTTTTIEVPTTVTIPDTLPDPLP